jgi:hypothetical protein
VAAGFGRCRTFSKRSLDEWAARPLHPGIVRRGCRRTHLGYELRDVSVGSNSAVAATLAAWPVYPRKQTDLLQRTSRQPWAISGHAQRPDEEIAPLEMFHICEILAFRVFPYCKCEREPTKHGDVIAISKLRRRSSDMARRPDISLVLTAVRAGTGAGLRASYSHIVGEAIPEGMVELLRQLDQPTTAKPSETNDG